MYHSIYFGKDVADIDAKTGKNTWDDWKLIPSSRPVFEPPTVKTTYVDIPGSDNVVDLTEQLANRPVYNNRQGSFEFVLADADKKWPLVYSRIANYLHGQHMIAILEDDKSFFYEGRFSINQWKSQEYYSTIVIDYNVHPYKFARYSRIEPWLWDPFDFRYGTIPSGINRFSLDTDPYTYTFNANGYMPLILTFVFEKISGNLMIEYTTNSGGTISKPVVIGRNTISDRSIFKESAKFKFKGGTGEFYVDYRDGLL